MRLIHIQESSVGKQVQYLARLTRPILVFAGPAGAFLCCICVARDFCSFCFIPFALSILCCCMALVWIIFCRSQAARFLDVSIRRLRVSTIATTINLVARNNLLRGEDWKLASLHEHLRFDFFGCAESPATGSCFVARGSMSSERG